MIYTINQDTKEHRIISNMREKPQGVEWKVVEADASGWIPWEGKGVSPVPINSEFEVWLRNGSRGSDLIGKWVYGKHDMGFDIIAYRPILDDPAAPGELKAPEWDGVGLPPSGIECEAWCDDKSEWLHVKTLDAYTNSGEMACTTIEPSGHFRRLFWGHKFRPLCTAAQRAEDEAVAAIDQAVWDADEDVTGSQAIYRAIRDGKIPGIKLEE